MIYLACLGVVIAYLAFAIGYSCGWYAAVRDLLTPNKKP